MTLNGRYMGFWPVSRTNVTMKMHSHSKVCRQVSICIYQPNSPYFYGSFTLSCFLARYTSNDLIFEKYSPGLWNGKPIVGAAVVCVLEGKDIQYK